MLKLNSRDGDFQQYFSERLRLDTRIRADIVQSVQKIIAEVRARGDAALLDYTTRFDHFPVSSMQELRVDRARLERAWQGLDDELKASFQCAAQRIQRYAEAQKLQSWRIEEDDGSILGQSIVPLDSAGLYVPGGKAAYPSSVLMNAIPAKVAGVARLVMVTPAPQGYVQEHVLAAAHLCGIDEVWLIGGAQAIAALAYGTQSIAPVDKITGPGNQFVATAKRAVFGKVGIDMIAGPSEVVVVADEQARPAWVAADLLAQAEHDELAQAILISNDAALIAAVEEEITAIVAQSPRAEIIQKSLTNRGMLIQVQDVDEGLELANRIAPEHLELALHNAQDCLPRIRHAGAVFVGEFSNEVLGDYCAGTNHVLPTSGTARFANSLGTYDFQKRMAVLQLKADKGQALSAHAETMARCEGLYAHALSAHLRRKA